MIWIGEETAVLSHEGEEAGGAGQWAEPWSQISWAASLGGAGLVSRCPHLWGQAGPRHGSGGAQSQQLLCWLSLGTEFLNPFLSSAGTVPSPESCREAQPQDFLAVWFCVSAQPWCCWWQREGSPSLEGSREDGAAVFLLLWLMCREEESAPAARHCASTNRGAQGIPLQGAALLSPASS